MEKEEQESIISEQLIKAGAINILALGYRGIELWRKNREPLTINEKTKVNEKEA